MPLAQRIHFRGSGPHDRGTDWRRIRLLTLAHCLDVRLHGLAGLFLRDMVLILGRLQGVDE